MTSKDITNLKELQVDKYIGIPYEVNGRSLSSIDCYGLVHLIYKEELDIELPSFVEDGIDANRTQELIAQYKEGWEQTDSPKAGDVVIFRIAGIEAHIALAISSTHFIHARQGQNSAIESFDNSRWKTRFVGSYKYSPKKSVVLNGIPHPLRTEKITTNIPTGSTIVQLQDWIIKEYGIAESYKPLMHIFVNGVRIPDEMKEHTIVKDGDSIEYRVVAQGGDNFLRTALTIAVVVFAPQLVASIGSIGGVALTTATGALTTAGSLAAIGLTAVGMALVDAIAPIRIPNSNFGDPTNPGSAEQQLMVNGGANRATPYSSIPFVLGKVRLTPPLGANTYNLFSADGRESYLRMLLVWGYGPVYVDESTLRIGELPISNYEGVIQETINYIAQPSTAELYNFNNIYGTDITQVPSGVELTCDGTAGQTSTNQTVVNTTVDGGGATLTLPANYIAGSISARLTGIFGQFTVGVTVVGLTASFYPIFPITELPTGTVISVSYLITAGETFIPPFGPWIEASSSDGNVGTFTVAIHFPQGCRRIISKGESAGQSQAAPVVFNIEWKLQSQSSWSNAGIRYTVGNTPTKDAFTWTQSFNVNSSQDVQVRVRRITGTGNTAPVDENYQWLFTSTLINTTFSRNTKPAVDPLNCNIAKTALQIKASDQLNGQIEGINAIVWTYGKSWNGTAWVNGNINNPAALFRHVLEHPANPRRVTDAANKINLTQLQYWHEYCTAKGFTYNSVVGSQRSVLDILRDICAAGRASPAMVDGKWTVVIDEVKTNVVQHFSPHNSWGFEGAKSLPRIPDGLRVTFLNEDKDYQEDETIVYSTGKSSANAALLESISVPGVTKLSQAQDHARWHMAQANLRPESYSLNTDIEYIVCNRGDRVKIMHDVPMWGLGSGRVKNRITDRLFELTEELPIDFSTEYSIRFRSKAGATNDRVIQKTFIPTFASRTAGVVTVTSADHPLEIGDSVAVTMTVVSLDASTAIVTAVTSNTFSYELAGADVADTAVTGTIDLNDGYYSKIRITVAATDVVADNDDLFLFGTLNQESQDCLVISIEPQDNKTARLSLVDYGVTSTYNIFTDYLNYTSATAFESQIALPPKLLIQSYGTKVPTITGVISDERVMQKIAAGVFAYNMQVSYTNAIELPSTVNTVEFQWDYDASIDIYGTRSKQVNYNLGSVTIPDVEEGAVMKVRARYVGTDGRTGQWSGYTTHTIVGKTNPPSDVIGFAVAVDGVTGKLRLSWNINTEIDIKVYEVRTDTNWGSTTNMIFLGDSTSCFDIAPDTVSATKIYYIKAIDYSNNYSSVAATTSFTASSPINIIGATYVFADTSLTAATVTISWENVLPVFGLSGYEISYDSTSRFVLANSITLPANWVGERNFVIKTVNSLGHKSSGYLMVINKQLPNPCSNFRSQVIDNTVMFYWDLPIITSLPIDHVLLKKGSTWETAVTIGEKKGGFTTQNETSAGVYTYWLASVDTDDNMSEPVSLTTAVAQPPDFVLFSNYLSDFTGTKSSSVSTANISGLILPVNTIETFQDHFINNSWSTPQNQIDAGYPIYIQPTGGTGYYEEVFDYGTLLTSSKVTVLYSGTIIAAPVSISSNISVSSNGSTWTDYIGVTEVFATAFRYVKIKIVATASVSTGLYNLTYLAVNLDSKLLNDAGNISCLSTDSLGTIVNFNKEFVDVTSITVSPQGTTAIIPVYDFRDNVVSATYSIVSNQCTVTLASHNFITGQKIRLGISTGTGVDGIYTITGYTTDTFTVVMTASDTSGNCSTYPQSFRIYLFNTSGTRVSSTASWSLKGY